MDEETQAVSLLRTKLCSALSKKLKGDSKEYRRIILLLSTADSSTVPIWFKSLSQCVAMVTADCAELIDSLLQPQYDILHEKFYENFVVALLSSNSCFCPNVLSHVIHSSLLRKDGDGKFNVKLASSTIVHFHRMLKRILSIVPAAPTILFPILESSFPHKVVAHEVQEVYFKESLQIIEYCPSLQDRIIALLVDKLIQIDVEIKLDDSTDDGTDMFEFETESLRASDENKPEVSVMAETLDLLMERVFYWIQSKSSKTPAAATEVFELLLKIFGHAILHTYESKYIQFLVYYASHFSEVFSKHLLAYLIDGSMRPTNHVMTRQLCVFYASSYVSRATFISSAAVRSSLSLWAQYLNKYLDNLLSDFGGSRNPVANRDQHLLFYTICQGLFYVLLFRHPDVIDTDGGSQFVNSLCLKRVIESSLNPLLICDIRVVREFSTMMHSRHLLHCQPIIERNRASRRGTKRETLEFYYPFDPLLLRRSSAFISAMYRCWPSNENEQEEGSNDSDEDSDESEILLYSDDESESLSLSGVSVPGGMVSESYNEDEIDLMSFTPDVHWDVNFHFQSQGNSK